LIKSVSPKSASPGDSVTLVGENFWTAKSTNSMSIGPYEPTMSDLKSANNGIVSIKWSNWTDTAVTFVVPENQRVGRTALVTVYTDWGNTFATVSIVSKPVAETAKPATTVKYKYCTDDDIAAFELDQAIYTCKLGSKMIEITLDSKGNEISRKFIWQWLNGDGTVANTSK
jgi:hypothetical protein